MGAGEWTSQKAGKAMHDHRNTSSQSHHSPKVAMKNIDELIASLESPGSPPPPPPAPP